MHFDKANFLTFNDKIFYVYHKAIADGPVGQVLARTLYLKVKIKFDFTESK